MRQKEIYITKNEEELLAIYQSLSVESQEIVDIVLKIGNSHVLTESEFHMLIQELMHTSL